MATTPSSPPSEASPLKLCPRCGRTTDAARNRCAHCWNDLKSAPVLAPAEAERHRALEQGDGADRDAIAARNRRRARYVQSALLVAVLILGGWWVYGTFFYTPSPPPAPVSTVRHVEAGPDSWPVAGGTLGGTRATAAGAHLPGQVAWTADLGSTFTAPIVSSADTVFATLTDARLVAIDPADGSERWSVPLDARPLAAPTVAGDRLYLALPGGVLIAFDVRTGDEVWRTGPVGSTFGSSPLVVGGMVYAFGVGELYGLDAETGEELWSHAVDSRWAFVTPVAEGDYLAVATGNRTLVFDRLAGQQTYFYEFERAHPYSIVLADGEVFTVSERFAASLEVDSRRPSWEGMRAVWNQFWIWGMAPEVPPPPSRWTAPDPPVDGYPGALSDTRLLVTGAGGHVDAFERATGERAWTVDGPEVVAPPILTADGLLLAHPGSLSLLDPANGQVLLERPIEGVTLRGVAVTDHGTYLATSDGRLLALR
ncbi:MAG: PQQ-binding-like beta-propeller repeat protein [Dehalococcoidia bacterium]|nr:PQQ-binding-like beta-propeller repeat protein [Dehalococcoidia bacterium]